MIARDPKIGTIVYESYYPLNPGVVISKRRQRVDYPKGGFRHDIMVSVRWLKKKGGREVTEIRDGFLNRLDDLIEATQKKLGTHTTNRAKLLKSVSEGERA